MFHKPRHINYIDSCHKESEIRAAYTEQSTVHFKNVANITVDRDSLFLQEKKMRVRKFFRQILTTKIRQKDY